MTLLLSSFRRVIEQDRMVREGRWREGRPALLQIPRLMGQTLGFIAFGHVARAVAMRAKPFGLRMIAYDPFIEELVMPQYDVLPATLDEVLTQSDFVSMHAPATPEAEGMLQEKHFRKMKKTAIFINTGRGPTVQEVGLIKALQEGWIAHAGLDVLEIEPPGNNNPILKMNNVTLSAHTASASARFDPARKRHVGRELALVLSGKWPMSCVNPAVLMNSNAAPLAARVDGARTEQLEAALTPRPFRGRGVTITHSTPTRDPAPRAARPASRPRPACRGTGTPECRRPAPTQAPASPSRRKPAPRSSTSRQSPAHWRPA